MGIHDREYYRDETRDSGWFSGVAPACKTIILINVVAYLAQLFLPGERDHDSAFQTIFSASSDAILRHFHVWQLVTAPFLHDPNDIFHIFWNMLFLWMAGREMEAMYGSREFSLLYLTAAVFSTFCWAVIDQISPGVRNLQMVGASGAVMTVLVLYTLYYPRREILLFLVLPVETWMLLVVYLGRDALMLLQQLQGGHGLHGPTTAFASHLGGAVYGFLYKTYDLRWSRLFSRRGRRPRLRVVGTEPRERERTSPLPTTSTRSASAGLVPRGPSPALFPEEQLDARLDEVLAKIAREGRSGLTDEENYILQEASRRARDRRSDRV